MENAKLNLLHHGVVDTFESVDVMTALDAASRELTALQVPHEARHYRFR
jgi:hypothetical protein